MFGREKQYKFGPMSISEGDASKVKGVAALFGASALVAIAADTVVSYRRFRKARAVFEEAIVAGAEEHAEAAVIDADQQV